MAETQGKPLNTEAVRSVLNTVARLIGTDRRPALLATDHAEILLANPAANRLSLDDGSLGETFNWPRLCARARRAGSIAISTTHQGSPLEGELVHLPLGQADGYLLRLAENDQEASLLRNRARAATLMRVTHDLRTPIQSLLATTEAAFQQADRGKTGESREKIQRAARQTLDHINNVLMVIRGELTVTDLQVDEKFNLAAELGAILELIDPIARTRGARVDYTQDPSEDIWVVGPVRFVRALLQNLVDNSVKYGGDTIDIHLKCRRDPPSPTDKPAVSVFVEVADLGGGLPEAQKLRLQRALGQGDPQGAQKPREEQGEARTSAGLNVLAHALRQLGGRMEILDRGEDGTPVTEPGAEVTGTILRVWFTLEAAEPPQDVAAPAPLNPGTALEGAGILIAEDSPTSRDWLVQTLQAAGAEVQAVENGLKALEILRRPASTDKIDLLLTDMTLPYMNGIELARRISAARASGDLKWQGKMLGLTAHVDDSLRAAGLKCGMVQVLSKPISGADLCQEVENVLRPPPADAARETEAPPQNNAGASDDLGALPLYDAGAQELIRQIGLSGARGFMQRALDEARTAWSEINSNGIGEDTPRKLHAATGACGLTGLKRVEHCLRMIELRLKAPAPDLTGPMRDLDAALRDTMAKIGQLDAEHSDKPG